MDVAPDPVAQSSPSRWYARLIAGLVGGVLVLALLFVEPWVWFLLGQSLTCNGPHGVREVAEGTLGGLLWVLPYAVLWLSAISLVRFGGAGRLLSGRAWAVSLVTVVGLSALYFGVALAVQPPWSEDCTRQPFVWN